MISVKWSDMKKSGWLWCACLMGVMLPQFAAGQDVQQNSERLWQLEPGQIVGGSSRFSGARLMDPVVFDMNGDGIDDIVFGAPGMSPNGFASAGSIYVLLGKQGQPLEGIRDTTSLQAFDYRFDGHTRNGQLGMNIVTGDFNGDGKLDMAVSEPGQMGAVYLFYGGTAREKGVYDVMQKGGADVSFVTSEAGSSLGLSMCTGDLNHDGITDLALASMGYLSGQAVSASQVTLLTMRRSWDKPSYDIGSKLYGKTTIVRPVSNGIRVLHSCAIGDFNDDGLADIALGMPLDTSKGQKAAGSVTIVNQPFRYNGTVIDIGKVDDEISMRISGDQANAQFGYSVAAGDFTGDGRDDLAVSSPNRLVKGPDNEGTVYVFDSNNMPKESAVQPQSLKISGKGGQFGYRIRAVDANGDNRPDLVISAPYAGTQSNGALSVYLGGPHFVESVEHSLRPDIEINGAEFMSFGLGADFGDVNGDSKRDAVVRVAADPEHRERTGAMAVLGAVSELPSSSTLGNNFMTITAPSQGGGLSTDLKRVQYQNNDYLAWFSPSGAGNRSVICLVREDRKGDNIALGTATGCDVQILGPENYIIADFAISKSAAGKSLLTIAVPDMPVKNATGFVAAIPLPDDISQPLALNLTESTLKTNATTYILENEPNSGLGTQVRYEDLNGDGFDELIIGAPYREIDKEISGSVFIVRGKAEQKMGFHNLSGSDVLALEGTSNEEFGSQFQVMDFNLDGEPDLIVRAAKSMNASNENYSTVYVFSSIGHRSDKVYSDLSPELTALRILAPQNRAGLEIIPQRIDVNNDGHADLVLLSPDYRPGLQKQGGIFVVYASGMLKSGELRLSEESHIGFSFLPGRNEKITDARFVRLSSKLEFIVVIADMASGLNHTINAYVDEDADIFRGQASSGKLKRTTSEARISRVTKLAVLPEKSGNTDALYLVFPHDGLMQSGQGIAQRVVPW